MSPFIIITKNKSIFISFIAINKTKCYKYFGANIGALFRNRLSRIITAMTQQNQKHATDEIIRSTFRRPKLLNDLVEAKAKSIGSTGQKVMVDELWKSVEGLRQEELKGKPSLETLQKHMAVTLSRIRDYSKHAATLEKMIEEEVATLLTKPKNTKKR